MSILVFDLKGYRIDEKLSQEEMAKKLGCNQGMVSYYERGKTRTKLSTINEIADKLGVPPGKLVREIPEDEVKLFDHIRKRKVTTQSKKDWIEETIREVEEAERKAQEGDLI